MRLCVLVLVLGCGRLGFAPGDDAATQDATMSSDDGGVTPTTGNVMFVTSTLVVPMMIGGGSGADAECQARATAASLPGTYLAYVSDASVDARDRFPSVGSLVRPDGKLVAVDLAGFIAGRIRYPPYLDEGGQRIAASTPSVATATSASTGILNTDSCNNWTTTGSMMLTGHAFGGDTRVTHDQRLSCDTAMRLYCIATDYAIPVEPPVLTGKRAFVGDNFAPGGGLAGGDNACATSAQLAGLTGSFRALLPTTVATAASRFAAGPRYRIDGVLFTSDFATFDAPLRQHADGSYSSSLVWTGAPSAMVPGTMQDTCNSWTGTGGNGLAGSNSFALASTLFTLLTYGCSNQLWVYCIEE